MAIFHFTVTQTKRSKGQSASASAAYRSGERLYSEYYGEYSDYTLSLIHIYLGWSVDTNSNLHCCFVLPCGCFRSWACA